MKHNMSKTERVVRIFGGIALFFLGWIVMYGLVTVFASLGPTIAVGYVLVIAGAVLLLTGLFSYCPINELIHHNSCEACKLGETHKHLPV